MFSFSSSKPPKDTKVVVAMSGGVDSSVVAAKLATQGYNVIGITLQLYDQGAALSKKGACCAGQDIYDAKNVADKFGFPHYVLDYESRFKESVVDDFADSYIRGETPLPCVRCNQSVKFKDLLKMAKDLNADTLATGHYVSKIQGENGPELHKAIDHNKDQSYFLFATTKEQLSFIQFPLGTMTKEQTRKEALDLGIEIANKPDSQDICFVPNGKYYDVIKKLRPNSITPGDIMHIDGFKLGTHEGIVNFTIGQRKGLKVAYGKPLYVVRIDPDSNIVYLAEEEKLFNHEFTAKDINWLSNTEIPEGGIDAEVKLRSTHKGTPARIYFLDDSKINVRLPRGEKSITPGQACVIYSGTRVLGGGWITRT